MAQYRIVINSAESGGTTTLTLGAGAQWILDSNDFSFQGVAGGSNPTGNEVKISRIQFNPTNITIVRNSGDGTHFEFVCGIDTTANPVSITTTKQAGGSIEVRSPVDSFKHDTQASPLTTSLRLA